jgi:hypothetical protein
MCMNRISKVLSTILIAAVFEVGCSGEKPAPIQIFPAKQAVDHQEKQFPGAEPSRAETANVEVARVDVIVRKTAAVTLEVKESAVVVKHRNDYGTALPHPIPGIWRRGEYIDACVGGRRRCAIFSRQGQYLGKLEAVAGRKNKWVAEEHHTPGESYRRQTINGWQIGQVETINADGAIVTEFDRRVPVYTCQGHTFITAKPYSGVFGGDGEHYLDDRSAGDYFLVEMMEKKCKGKVCSIISETGQFFHQYQDKNTPNGRYNADYIKAIKKNGKLQPFYGATCKKIADCDALAKEFRQIVPKALRR